jgi:large subunit ribosomal protein L24
MKIHKNDTVQVIAGKDRGKKGKVRYAYPKKGKLLVDGVNRVKKSMRASGQSRPGGIIEREALIDVSNVMYVCGKCNKPARLGFLILNDGKKVRMCRSCHEVVD